MRFQASNATAHEGGIECQRSHGVLVTWTAENRCSFELGKRIERVIIDYAKQHFEGEHSNSS